jgi:uncharacterized protein YxjI
MHSAFLHNQYLIKKQVLALTGVFRVYDPAGNFLLYSRQKMFKLREDIRVYSDEQQTSEILYIQARQILDFSAAYDIFDQTMGSQLVGTLRRKGWSSLARDQWEVLDPSGRVLGILWEDSLGLALLRRLLLGSLLPQNYDMLFDEQRVADLRQRFNLFRYELDLDFTMDPSRRLDRRVGIAAGILLGAIEGKQSN